MERARFEEIIELFISIYRNQGEEALFAERDRINQQLAPDFLRIDLQGPIYGNMLTVLLYSVRSQRPQEIDRTTRMWIPITALPCLNRSRE